MANNVIEFKAGFSDIIEATLKEKTGVAAVLGASTVTLYFRRKGSNPEHVVNRSATVVSAPNGTVSYTIVSGDYTEFVRGSSWDMWWVANTPPSQSVGVYPSRGFDTINFV